MPGTVRVAAANSILDRGYGKPAQALSFQNDDGESIPIRTIEVVMMRSSDERRPEQARIIQDEEDQMFDALPPSGGTAAGLPIDAEFTTLDPLPEVSPEVC